MSIFYPVAALVGLTFAVLVLVPIARIRAARAGRVSARDFKFGESANVPGDVALPNRNFMNLLELPLLFYVACIAFYVTAKVDAAALGLAWAYVALRVVHSVIHLTYNRVLHRLAAYGASVLILLSLWIYFVVRVAG